MNQSTIIRHLDALAKLDPDLQRGLKQVQYPAPRIRKPGFETLLNTVVSQQISTEAAAAVMRRVEALMPRMEAQELLLLPQGALREAGLSMRKVEYAQGLAKSIVDGSFDVAGLAEMDDEEAIRAITALRGFGPWSAEIYLMFSLQRRDIFPAGDLALRIALQRLKFLAEPPDDKQARKILEPWSPYRSAGSLFLWHFYRGAPA